MQVELPVLTELVATPALEATSSRNVRAGMFKLAPQTRRWRLGVMKNDRQCAHGKSQPRGGEEGPIRTQLGRVTRRRSTAGLSVLLSLC